MRQLPEALLVVTERRQMRRMPAWILFALFALTVRTDISPFSVQEAVGQDAAAGASDASAVPEESPLLAEPTTPEAAFDAVVLMIDLGRQSLARRYLDLVMKFNPDDTAILKMRDKHGPAIFLKLAHIKALQPQSLTLMKQMSAAFRKNAFDPARLDQLIADLTLSPQKREVAISQLRGAGPVIVPRLLSHLKDEKLDTQRHILLYTLTRLGKQNIPALLGALETPDMQLRSIIIESFGWLEATEAIPYLWYPAFAPESPTGVRVSAREALSRILFGTKGRIADVSAAGAVSQLVRIARIHFRNDYNWQRDDNGNVPFWNIDTKSGQLEAQPLDAIRASLITGSRFARQALSLAPENQDVQALLLGFMLAADVHSAGWDRPLPTGEGTAHDLALTAGADVVNRVLAIGMDEGNLASAWAALQVLGQVGTRHQLYHNNSVRSPLVSALNYPDPRVQFAASSVILQFDPEKPFRGARRVVEIMVRALSDSGKAHAVIVDSDETHAAKTAAIFNELGYESHIAPTGQAGFRTAIERGDVELIVLRPNTIRWGISQTIANLRADARTGRIPVVIYGAESLQYNVKGLTQRYPLTTSIVEGTTSEHAGRYLRQFLAKRTTPQLTAPQRGEMRRAAVYWLAHIADGRRTDIFKITDAAAALFAATNRPELAEDAIYTLSLIGTNSTQQRLKDIAVNANVDVKVQTLAATQLAFHIQRFGLTLDDNEIGEVRASWQSVSDPELKTAFASVIGSLKPSPQRVTERLRRQQPVSAAGDPSTP